MALKESRLENGIAVRFSACAGDEFVPKRAGNHAGVID